MSYHQEEYRKHFPIKLNSLDDLKIERIPCSWCKKSPHFGMKELGYNYMQVRSEFVICPNCKGCGYEAVKVFLFGRPEPLDMSYNYIFRRHADGTAEVDLPQDVHSGCLYVCANCRAKYVVTPAPHTAKSIEDCPQCGGNAYLEAGIHVSKQFPSPFDMKGVRS